MQFRSVNPYDGQVLEAYPGLNLEQVNQKIESAHQAYIAWKETTYKERADLMQSVSLELTDNKQVYAETVVLEMGKPLKRSRGGN